MQSEVLDRRNTLELNKIKKKILNMKINNWQGNINSPLYRIDQIHNPATANKQSQSRNFKSKSGTYTSGGIRYSSNKNNYLSEKYKLNPYLV